MRESLRPDLVLLDIWMPDVDGITPAKEWGATGQLTMPVIMMSGHGTIDTAVGGHQVRRHRVPEKPITLQKLLRAVEQALAKPGRCAPPTAALGGGGARTHRAAAADGAANGLLGGGPLHRPTARSPSRASTSTVRCARRATPSRRATSSSTWPRKAAR